PDEFRLEPSDGLPGALGRHARLSAQRAGRRRAQRLGLVRDEIPLLALDRRRERRDLLPEVRIRRVDLRPLRRLREVGVADHVLRALIRGRLRRRRAGRAAVGRGVLRLLRHLPVIRAGRQRRLGRGGRVRGAWRLALRADEPRCPVERVILVDPGQSLRGSLLWCHRHNGLAPDYANSTVPPMSKVSPAANVNGDELVTEVTGPVPVKNGMARSPEIVTTHEVWTYVLPGPR